MKHAIVPWTAALVLALEGGFASADARIQRAQPDRVRPPAQIDCPRDHLTAYTGRVVELNRRQDKTSLHIKTDWATTERLTLNHPGSNDPSPWFLMKANAFTSADWARLEAEAGRLRSGIRATAWVCDDGRNPVIDWQPAVDPPQP